MQWKCKSTHRRSFHYSYSDCYNNVVVPSQKCTTNRYPPPGFIFVIVGSEHKRFLIPIRFLNLTIFKCLLREAAEEFGHRVNGCLILPCEISFFREIIKHLKKNEHVYGKLSLEEFVNMINFRSHEDNIVPFTPLLRKVAASELTSLPLKLNV